MAFSPDGDRIIAGDLGVTAVAIWDVSATGGASGPTPSERRSLAAAWPSHPTASVLLSSGRGGLSRLDVRSAELTALVAPGPGTPDVSRIALSPDGTMVATSPEEGDVSIRNVATGVVVATVATSVATGLSWSADSTRLAVATFGDPGSGITVVDRAGRQLGRFDEDPDIAVGSVSMSPDGRRVAMTRARMSREDQTVMTARIWDWERDEIVQTIEGGTALRSPSIAPARPGDGRLAGDRRGVERRHR